MTSQHKRRPRPARCPTLVAMHLAPEVGLTERLAIEGLAGGWAKPYQFDVLADCRDLLALAANHKGDQATLAVCDLASIALENIRDRFKARGRLGATGDELRALRAMADVSEDFWKRQSGELFRAANEALDKERGHQRRAAR
ncbi:MAG: hypothetical protein ROZ00_04840 [Denitratisoma sp.]|nr:hypothetical protein [Denitratisoma sp.]